MQKEHPGGLESFIIISMYAIIIYDVNDYNGRPEPGKSVVPQSREEIFCISEDGLGSSVFCYLTSILIYLFNYTKNSHSFD